MFDDRREEARRRTFNRRSMVLFGLQLTVAGVLGARLYRLQVTDSEEFQTRAENNRTKESPLAPVRGEIFDRNGLPLAVNLPNYILKIVPERASDLEKAISEIRQFVEMSEKDMRDLRRSLSRSRAFQEVLVKENLDWKTFARLNANAPAMPYAVADVGQFRSYPEADALAHVIGFVGKVNERDLQRERRADRRILLLPGARIGKQGVERAAEKILRGKAALRKIEINAGGREVGEIARVEGEPGADLTLTIDRDLQRYTMERIKGESASVVVMDVLTGDLLTLASGPAFDPNKFVTGMGVEEYRDLSNDAYQPLLNKATSDGYPPGSTFKMITALAALESGKVTTRTSSFCNGRHRFGNRIFHCWKRQGHGRVRMQQAVKNSCDVYFYEAAQAAGIDLIADVAQRFGVGEAPELETTGVIKGINPSPRWARSVGRRWNGGEVLNVGIGQGALQMSPLQMAVMTARLANGREQVRPRLIRAINGVEPDRAPFAPLGVSEEGIRIVHSGMYAVSNERGGTAFRSRIADPANEIAGKTGTAQVRRISTEERARGVRKNEDLEWRLRDHALFVAFAPANAPRYSISVFVKHGGSGSKAAAPIARDVMMRLLYGPQPPLEAYPAHMRKEIEAARRAAEEARRTGADPLRSLN